MPALPDDARQPSRRQLLGAAAAGLGLACAARVHAADETPRPPQRAALVLAGATAHTPDGPVANARVLLDRGRIAAIAAPGAALAVPPDATTLDLTGRHLHPGHVLANSSLGLTEVSSVRATQDHTELGSMNPNARTQIAINADSEHLAVARSNGVLSALVVPTTGGRGGLAGWSTFVQLDGWHWDDMTLVADLAQHVELPSLRTAARHASATDAMRAELRRSALERLRAIELAFDAAHAFARARAADADRASDPRWAALAPCIGGARPVFVQADERAQIRWALDLADRHGLRMVIVGGAEAPALAPLLRARDLPVVLTGTQDLPLRRDDAIDARFEAPARLADAGVRWCIALRGGAGGSASARNLPYVAAACVPYGLPAEEARRATTLYAARILGVDDRVGSLAPGRLAHLMVTDGDPLQLSTRIERIFMAGREVDAGNRQLRLQRKYEQRLEPGR